MATTTFMNRNRNNISLIFNNIIKRSVVTKIESPQQFNSIIQGNTKKLLAVEYYAEWCVPCKRMQPVFERLSNEYDDICKFVAIDCDQQSDLIKTLEIRSIPTFDFIKDRKLVNRITGELPRELEQRILQFSKDDKQ